MTRLVSPAPVLMLLTFACALVFASALVRADEPEVSERELLWRFVDADRKEKATELRARLVESGAGVAEVAAWLRAGRPDLPPREEASPWEEIRFRGAGGRMQTAVLRVPESYKAGADRAPLVVELHGGVMTPRPIRSAEMRETDYSIVGAMEDKAFYLQPKGTRSAVWWSRAGRANVMAAIREVKRRYPIDSNRVYLGGFSDGGSGTYFYAFADPTPFAAFVPLNGFAPYVQSGGLQIHPRNALNRPLYIVATGRDFYPLPIVRAVARSLREAGVDTTFKLYPELPHAPIYMNEEEGKIAEWFKRQVREPYPRRLVWETADPRWSPGLHWLRIRELGEDGVDHPFPEVNPSATTGGPRLGITVDPEWADGGVRVATVVEDSAASAAGLQPGDVVVGLDGDEVVDLDGIKALLGGKAAGAEFVVKVVREGRDEPLKLKGQFAEGQRLFDRSRASGVVEAEREGNTFDVRVAGVKAFDLLLSEDMVDFDEPIVVKVNGREVHRAVVEPTLEDALTWAREFADPTQVYTRTLSVEVPAAEATPATTSPAGGATAG